MGEENFDMVAFARAWLNAEEEAGQAFAPLLLATPTGLWRSEMNRDPNLRRYGTIHALLDAVFDQVLYQPEHATERAVVLVDYVDGVAVPTARYQAFIGGYAWKVYANALRFAGKNPDALVAAQKSQAIFNRVGSLATEAAKAQLVEAVVLREIGTSPDEVLRLVLAAEKLLRGVEAEGYVNARIIHALVLTDSKRYAEALALLVETTEDAERRGDKRAQATCLHNTAEIARAIGDIKRSRELNRRARKHFEELGISVELPRLRWSEAMALADEGNTSEAIMECYRARTEFLALGMSGSAADVGLEIVRIRFHRGENVMRECAELVETLAKAGMIQPAIEALAYLREQARMQAMSDAKIDWVRSFVRDSANGIVRAFLPPPAVEK